MKKKLPNSQIEKLNEIQEESKELDASGELDKSDSDIDINEKQTFVSAPQHMPVQTMTDLNTTAKYISVQIIPNINTQRSVEKANLLSTIQKLIGLKFKYLETFYDKDSEKHGLVYINNKKQNLLIQYQYDHEFTESELNGLAPEWKEEDIY